LEPITTGHTYHITASYGYNGGAGLPELKLENDSATDADVFVVVRAEEA
jgi:hypothetical protein